MENDNEGVTPCLALYHANARKTGAALRMWLHPVAAGQPGCISLKLAEQKGPDRFDWRNALYVQLGLTDLAKILMVFTGWVERTENEGAGMDNTIRHTLDDGNVIAVDLSHKVDPYPSYSLTLTKHILHSNKEQVQISLSNAEALAITEAIRGAMHYVAFGVPHLVEKEDE